jgi:hypothetical protein
MTYDNLADALHDLSWLSSRAEGYEGDEKAADELVCRMEPVEGVEASSVMSLLREMEWEGADWRDVGGGYDLYVWEVNSYTLVWFWHLNEEVFLLTPDEVEWFLERAGEIVVEVPE